ncbi:SDR family NAD(P)-dependent oxidoreductase [Streptomyces mobaraensis NBRC 13819 = DSM 40847]|uniref:Short chain dehydrogenase n=1 Tax=Streptomyces mobaraensis (strain ATCC 29032 / DSM 40847 / JCM 4168 / NBRC 13819 / NCIMB 11159 / IPCR 16-22) TaxID=1223523 RepID=M3BLN9_STRM1|nr:SDR family NAD(P)-dependent oxidoreductase [Streptomyces mobaraensis]EMF00505.1 short chain dehydrogenase [Streptomyces mobaraensis NBRC 13819 = DSM 40847]QTT74856.1 SDR family NAD(P)-dependent oxidoreductase [Streptomyces mobaraensis NBRC 13819 = DSM 40847]
MRINEAVALVTGANRGIGRALVTEFLSRGAARVHAAARDPRTLEPLVAEAPDRIVPLTLDITDPAAVTAAAEAAPDVTLLVNNAGRHGMGHLLEMDLTDVEAVMRTNWLGTLHVLRAFAPVVERNGGGAVANIVSVGAFAGTPAMGAYPASKAALALLTQAVRVDLAPRGITVHAVFPGPVETDMLRYATGHLKSLGDVPTASAADAARAIADGVEAGDEEIFPDPFARQVQECLRTDPKGVERLLLSRD